MGIPKSLTAEYAGTGRWGVSDVLNSQAQALDCSPHESAFSAVKEAVFCSQLRNHVSKREHPEKIESVCLLHDSSGMRGELMVVPPNK
jgi:hypothetical protein